MEKQPMNSKPLVTILVGVYNQEKVIKETLASITSQTYDNLEIIVSDDCSTDGTREVLKRFVESHPRIHLFLQEKNIGIAGNYNFLASAASGKYVSIFAGDDVMCPDKIKCQVQALEESPDASFCHHAVFDLDARTNKVRGVISHHYDGGITTIHHVLRNLGIPGAMTIMYLRCLAQDPVFDPGLKSACDWLQIIHLTMSGQGVYIDRPLCYYRRDAAYNGKDPTQYEGDFIQTIKLTRSTYANPGDVIDQSCDFALARYSLGAGYRRLMRGEKLKARALFSSKMPSLKLAILSSLLTALSFFPVSNGLLIGFKNLYRSGR